MYESYEGTVETVCCMYSKREGPKGSGKGSKEGRYSKREGPKGSGKGSKGSGGRQKKSRGNV